MPILKNKKSIESNKKVVGVLLPLPLCETLYLYSFSEAIPVSKILENLVVEWKKTIPAESELITRLNEKLLTSWDGCNPQEKKQFCVEVEKQLKNKISPEIVSKIVKEYEKK